MHAHKKLTADIPLQGSDSAMHIFHSLPAPRLPFPATIEYGTIVRVEHNMLVLRKGLCCCVTHLPSSGRHLCAEFVTFGKSPLSWGCPAPLIIYNQRKRTCYRILNNHSFHAWSSQHQWSLWRRQYCGRDLEFLAKVRTAKLFPKLARLCITNTKEEASVINIQRESNIVP